MERNHCQATPPSSPSVPVMMDSCRRRLVRRSSRMTGITGDNSRGFLENEDMVSRGFQMAESMFREWTDEKHSLYLNSIEELFVKQLYNGKFHCTDLLGWQPKSEKLPKLNTSQQLNANTCSSTAEFKVLQDDCWQKKRAQPQLDIVGGCHVLLKNPWTQHFRSAGKRVVVSGDVISAQEKGLLCGQAFDVRGMKAAPCDVATSSKQLLTCQFHILNQASVRGMTEVSDQNFVDGHCEGEMLSNLCRAKKMKAVVADSSGKDQVVPFGNSPVIAKSHENNAFGKRKTCS